MFGSVLHLKMISFNACNAYSIHKLTHRVQTAARTQTCDERKTSGRDIRSGSDTNAQQLNVYKLITIFFRFNWTDIKQIG